MLRGVLLVCMVLATAALAGCASDRPLPSPVLSSFSALYTPLGTADTGFEVTLAPATLQTDRDLQQRKAYLLTVQNPARPGPGNFLSIDSGFKVVRTSSCLLDDGDAPASTAAGDCAGRTLAWPDEDAPAPWGIGWTFAPPHDAEGLDGGHVLVRDGIRYEYEGDQLAPSLITSAEPRLDGPWGYRLATYDVRGALGPADDWPAPAAPLANATRDFLVHPGEDVDFLGLGWTTKHALDHLATHEEAGAILRDGGCVLSYSVSTFPPLEVAPGVTWPDLLSSDGFVHVRLQDREGRTTQWSFSHQFAAWGIDAGSLAGRFSEPQGGDLWPFLGEVSCEERSQLPPPRLDVAEAWARAAKLMSDPVDRGFGLDVFHQPPSHTHGGISPASVGFEAHVHVWPRDREGYASSVAWDLWRDSLVKLMLLDEDGPTPP